jgi:hypothetical protein
MAGVPPANGSEIAADTATSTEEGVAHGIRDGAHCLATTDFSDLTTNGHEFCRGQLIFRHNNTENPLLKSCG